MFKHILPLIIVVCHLFSRLVLNNLTSGYLYSVELHLLSDHDLYEGEVLTASVLVELFTLFYGDHEGPDDTVGHVWVSPLQADSSG